MDVVGPGQVGQVRFGHILSALLLHEDGISQSRCRLSLTCFLYPSVPRELGQVSEYRYQILCADHCFLTLEKTV